MHIVYLALAAAEKTSQAVQATTETVSDTEPSTFVVWLDNNGLNIIIAVAIVIFAYVFRWIFLKWLKHKILSLTSKTKTEYDNLIASAVLKPIGFVILVSGFYLAIRIGTQYYHQNDAGHPILKFLNTAIITLFSLIVGWVLWRLIDVLELFLVNFTKKTESTLDDQLVPLVRKAARILVVCITGLLVIENLGGSVTGLVAGLGVGALTFALAGQEIVSNLFGSVIIFVDRPFNIGDVIKVDGEVGVVSEVGFRSTRITTFDKTEIVIPNRDVAHKKIENISKRPMRKVRFVFSVAVSSAPDNLAKFVNAIQDLLDKQEAIAEGAVAKISGFGEMGVEILVQYWLKNLDYSLSLATNETVVLNIMKFAREFDCPVVSRLVATSENTSELVKPEQEKAYQQSAVRQRAIEQAKSEKQPAAEFKPTKKQLQYLKVYKKNLGKNLTLKQLAEESGISYNTIMTWRRSEAFNNWLEQSSKL